MNSYLNEINSVYNIETALEDKLFKQMENKLYDDSFLAHFKHAFLELKLSNVQNLDYNFIKKDVQSNLIPNKLDSKITKVQILSELINELQLDNFKRELNIQTKLKETFDIVLQKNDHLNIKNKYTTVADKSYDDMLIDTHINQIPSKSDGDIAYYDFLTSKIITKFDIEHTNYIFKILNSLNMDNNLLLHIPFAPHIKTSYHLYVLLCHLFETVTILFPLNLSITTNKVIIICNKKVNNINMADNSYIITKDKTHYDKMIKFETEIFNFVSKSLKLFLYMLLIKRDEAKYNILKYKVINSITKFK